jgi:hypothetical protein
LGYTSELQVKIFGLIFDILRVKSRHRNRLRPELILAGGGFIDGIVQHGRNMNAAVHKTRKNSEGEQELMQMHGGVQKKRVSGL